MQSDMLVLSMINAGSLSIPCLHDPVTRELHEHGVSRQKKASVSFPVIVAVVAEADQCVDDSAHTNSWYARGPVCAEIGQVSSHESMRPPTALH